eukprot:3095199-Prymnesium_polylepis.1
MKWPSLRSWTTIAKLDVSSCPHLDADSAKSASQEARPNMSEIRASPSSRVPFRRMRASRRLRSLTVSAVDANQCVGGVQIGT